MSKTLQPRQRRAIELFAANQFATKDRPQIGEADVARAVGVRRETLWRWKQTPEFAAALEEAVEAWFDSWRQETRHLYLTHRVGRLEELHRIYKQIPDDALATETKSGREVRRLNTDAQCRVMELIAAEMAGDLAAEMDGLLAEIEALGAGRAIPLRPAREVEA